MPACGRCTRAWPRADHPRRSRSSASRNPPTRAGSASSASRKARSRVSSSRSGSTWQWMRNVVPARTSEPTSMGRLGGHGSGPGCGPNPSSLQHRRHDRNVGRRRGDRQVHDPLAGQPGNRRAADVLDRQVRATLVDQLRDGRRHLDRPWIPRFDCCGQSDVGSDRRVHRGSVECRHATGHRPARLRGRRRLSHQPDRPVGPGGRGCRHRRRPRRPAARGRRNPAALIVGIDAAAPAMADASRRADRRGPTNALFLAAGVETLSASPLAGRADLVTVPVPVGFAATRHGGSG